MAWFGPSLPIDQDELEWQLAALKWIRHQDEALPKGHGHLVQPTDEFFPSSVQRGRDGAREFLDAVMLQCGMADWPCRLEEGEEDKPHRLVSGHALVHSGSNPLGTFSIEGNEEREAVIRYKPSSLANPVQLVATLAHEVAHYRMACFESPPPGGWKLEELATDLLAVYLGFGIFLANSARNFQGFSSFDEQGWQSQRSGYLSEEAIVTALAITERARGRDPLAAAPHLKPHLAATLKKANRYLEKHHPRMLESIEAVDLDDFAA